MWSEQTLELGSGRSLHLHQAGRGPDVLLIHGALTTSHDWRTSPVAAALARSCRVTAIDRPGHGRSRRPRFEGTPRDQAAQIAQGIERLGLQRPIVVGHSFGGLVSLALAERHADSVGELILLAPIAFPEPRTLEHSLLAPRAVPFAGPLFSRLAERTALDRTMLPLIHRLMFDPQPVPDHWRETYPFEKILDPAALVFEGEDAAAILPLSAAGTIDLAAVTVPAHVLTGTADRIVEDERQAKRLARLLPEGRLTEIEGAGHMLHHTHSDPVLSAILEAVAPAA
jgi:pimeloyl-ACP methyl ester carboxylesterase